MKTITTIPKSVTGNKELIIIPRKEYEEMKSRILPVVQLKGKAAQRLDRRVENAVREYRRGKTIHIQDFLKKKYPGLLRSYGN